ncbi:MAG TPA: DUF1385 domain-containing protein, partial [Clostridiaceae bacterium]|nr:DUF1385 domain-containing protein [Clostridiaceae bacterium]
MAVGITALIESAELTELAAEEPSTDLPESSDTSVTETDLQSDPDIPDLSGSVDVTKLVEQLEPATVAPSTNYSQTDEINDVGSTVADDLEGIEVARGVVASGAANDLEGIEIPGGAVTSGEADDLEGIEIPDGTVTSGVREISDNNDAAGGPAQPNEPEKSSKPEKSNKREKSGKFDAWLERHSNLVLWGMVVVALGFSVVFFILLPSLLTDGLRALITWLGGTVSQNNFFLSLIEGIIRITIFVLYLWFASRMEEIKRVWMYHGSEHKAIAAYEAGEELTVENVRKHSRFHPRCGTAFMFLVMVVSILVFALVGRHGPLINLLLRLLLLPIVTAISYELIRLAGRFDNPVTRFVSLPGLAMQRFTTAEPDDS